MYLLILSLFFCGISFAQNTITGSVKDLDDQPVPGANITVVGQSAATVTDASGNFKLSVTGEAPYTIEVRSIGFGSRLVTVENANESVSVMLSAQETKLDEIVVSASRTPERILESPVTVERMGLKEVRNTSSPTFYEGLENLKEVHFNTSSMSFKSINTRGFATVANTRFMQLVDGMDNSSPALNFVLGNLVGLSDLDVQSVELLPGASSALYGANAFNGILFMNSKNPFDYHGISTYFKYGKTEQDAAGVNDYYDFGIRMAHKFNDYIAVKTNFTFMKATEWIANDYRSMTNGGVGHEVNQNYDGLNLYGDEVTTFIPNVGQVSRTGYAERDLNDNKIESVKFDFAMYFRPFKNDLEVILSHKLGLGSTIYQGANRYKLDNFIMQQSKFEVRNKNFFARVYYTTEDAGNSYDMRFAAWNVNRQWKSDTEWFTNYATAYQLSSAIMGVNTTDAAGIGRAYADYNQLPAALQGLPQFAVQPANSRFLPGTPEFKNAMKIVTSNPDQSQGAQFVDQSSLVHSDVNYNFKELIDVAEIQVGGSFRQYNLNSGGTIFTDYDGAIKYDEYGVYTQVQKKFADDRVKFTGSLRYDKSQNFDGQVSPRISFVYSAGERKNHNVRASFQTGFRNPTTQDQYIGLDLGPFVLIGSAQDNLDRYTETLDVSLAGQMIPGVGPTVTFTGNTPYNNDVYSLPSVQKFAISQNPGDLEVVRIKLVKPEQVKAFEIGYKSVIQNSVTIDVNAYYNIYNDFMSTSRVVKPYYGTVAEGITDVTDPAILAIRNGDRRVFQVYTNTTESVSSYGVGVGVSKRFFGSYEIGANYNFAAFDFDQQKDPAFVAGFNTPKHRIKASLGNDKLFENFGFNINVRWSDEYLWQSSFADGIIPAVTVMDAQLSYAVPVLKSVFKASASNLFGEDYLQVTGAGKIGKMYLISWIINP